MWDWVQMNRRNLEAVCQRKGIVRIQRFHFDHDECSADAAFPSGLRGGCWGGGQYLKSHNRAGWGTVQLASAGVCNVWKLNYILLSVCTASVALHDTEQCVYLLHCGEAAYKDVKHLGIWLQRVVFCWVC